MKTAQIEVQIYETEDGRHTCASDFSKGEICQFLCSAAFGTKFSCSFCGDKIRGYNNDLMNFLEPSENCPVSKVVNAPAS